MRQHLSYFVICCVTGLNQYLFLVFWRILSSKLDLIYMHSTCFSFQGFQGKVGSKGDVVSGSFVLLNWTLRNSYCCVLYFSSMLTYFLYSHSSLCQSFSLSAAFRVTPVLKDWLGRKVKR